MSKTAEPEQSKINHRRANAVMRRNALTSLPVIDVSPFMDGG